MLYNHMSKMNLRLFKTLFNVIKIGFQNGFSYDFSYKTTSSEVVR